MNHYYAVFLEDTGVLIRFGECPPDDVSRQALFRGEVAKRVAGPVDPDAPPTITDPEPKDE